MDAFSQSRKNSKDINDVKNLHAPLLKHVIDMFLFRLMNIHITPRTIYLSRHGESLHNTVGRIGGDTDLSPRGAQYAEKLSEFINNQNIPGITCINTFCSSKK